MRVPRDLDSLFYNCSFLDYFSSDFYFSRCGEVRTTLSHSSESNFSSLQFVIDFYLWVFLLSFRYNILAAFSLFLIRSKDFLSVPECKQDLVAPALCYMPLWVAWLVTPFMTPAWRENAFWICVLDCITRGTTGIVRQNAKMKEFGEAEGRLKGTVESRVRWTDKSASSLSYCRELSPQSDQLARKGWFFCSTLPIWEGDYHSVEELFNFERQIRSNQKQPLHKATGKFYRLSTINQRNSTKTEQFYNKGSTFNVVFDWSSMFLVRTKNTSWVLQSLSCLNSSRCPCSFLRFSSIVRTWKTVGFVISSSFPTGSRSHHNGRVSSCTSFLHHSIRMNGVKRNLDDW